MSSSHQKENSKTEDTVRMATIVGPSKENQSHRWRVSFHTSHNSGTVRDEDTFEVSYISENAPFKGYGKTGARYKNGQQVLLTRIGDTQEWVISGAIPNSIGPNDEGDPDHQHVASHPRNLALHGRASKANQPPDFIKDALGKVTNNLPLQDIKDKVANSLKQADNKLRVSKHGDNDPIKDNAAHIRRVLREDKKLGRYATKISNQINKSIGSFAFNKSDMTDPTKAIQSLVGKAGELIPNAQSMIQNLKSAVKSGSPVSALSAVGGSKLIQQALSGIAMARSGQSDSEDELLDWLCELFLELFPDQECHLPNGEPTPLFLKWKKEYLLELKKQQGLIS